MIRVFQILFVTCALCPSGTLAKLVDMDSHSQLGAEGEQHALAESVNHKSAVPIPLKEEPVAAATAASGNADIVAKVGDHMPGMLGEAIRDGSLKQIFLVVNTMLALAVACGLASIILRHTMTKKEPQGEAKTLTKQLAQSAQEPSDAPNQGTSQAPQHGAGGWSLIKLGPIILVWYCFFSVSHTFFQHRAASVSLSPVVPTIIIYVFKLFLAVGMFVTQDGTLSDLFNAIRSNAMVVVYYALPAACLAFYDVFSFLTLARMAPSQYQILLHLRTVLIALCWQVVMGKKLSVTMWVLLLSCIYAAMLTERQAVGDMLATGGIIAGLGQYTTLGIQYTLSITGNLSNEFFLTRVKLTVNAQNAILYSLGTIILCIALLVGSISKGAPMFRVDEIPKVFDTNVMMSILTLTLVGISTGFVLKLMGNIWKELAGMVVTFVTASIDWFVLHNRAVGPIDIQALVIISCSLAAFSLLEKGESAKAAATPTTDALKK